MKIAPTIFPGLPEQQQIFARIGRKENDPETIIEAVCACLEIDRIELMSKCRKKELSEGRCIAIGLILQVNPHYGLKKLGILFGGRDHSTCSYNRDTYNNLYKRDKPFTLKVQEVLKHV